MAYAAIYANGSTFNMVKKFVIDSLNEIYEIDTSQLSPGSRVLDISSSKTYMLNNKKQWIEVQMGTGGGSGGASIELDTTLTQSGKAADAKAVGDALAEKQPTGDYLTQDNLQSATNAALEQAKASGEFDGDPGVVISTTQPTSDSHPVWITPEGTTDQYLELRGIFTPVVKTTMDEVAQAGVMYCLGEQTAVTIPLPDNADVGQMISVVSYTSVTAATLSITGTMLPCAYAPSANSRIEVNALWDGRYWSIVCNETEVPS